MSIIEFAGWITILLLLGYLFGEEEETNDSSKE